MRVCVVSDTHRNTDELYAAALIAGDVDLFLHAGDETADAVWLQNVIQREVVGVAGNWDRENDSYPWERVVSSQPSIFMTHGHRVGVKESLTPLAKRAAEYKAPIAVFGHTHVAIAKMVGNVLCLNPGSLTFPRGLSVGTFALLDISSETAGYRVLVRHYATTGQVVLEDCFTGIN